MRTISKATWRAHPAAIQTNVSASPQHGGVHDNQTGTAAGNRFHDDGVTLSDIHQFHPIQHLLLPHVFHVIHSGSPEIGPKMSPPAPLAVRPHFLGSSAASLCFFTGRKWISCELTFFSLIALFFGTFLSALLGSLCSPWDPDDTP